jgi:hypothetical protein
MNNSRGVSDTIAWIGAIGGGIWLSMKVAQCVVDCVGAVAGIHRAEPVREVVQEVLAEHQDEDTPIVHAFQEALESEEAEEAGAGV